MGESFYDDAFDDGLVVADVDAEYHEPPQVEEEPIDDDAYNLIYRGELTEVVTVGNHRIKIRTLKIGEELEASLLASRFGETADAGRAMAVALVAASVVSVDDEPLVQLLGPKEVSLDAKYKYIMDNWYWATVAAVYTAYDNLLGRSLEVLEELKKD